MYCFNLIANFIKFASILGAPYITYYSVEMVTFEGNRVDLVCNATNDVDANIPVQISWYNGTELIKPDGKLVMVYSEQNNITGQIHSVLSLNSVNYTDSGKYVCRAFNHPLSFTESRITLIVECKLSRAHAVICMYYVATYCCVVTTIYFYVLCLAV